MKRLILLVSLIWFGSVLAHSASTTQVCFSCYMQCQSNGVPRCTWVFDFGMTGCAELACITCTESGSPCLPGSPSGKIFQIDDQMIQLVAKQYPRYAAVLAVSRGMTYAENKPIKMYLAPVDIHSKDIKYFLHPKEKESEDYFEQLRGKEQKLASEGHKPIVFLIQPTEVEVQVKAVSNLVNGEVDNLTVPLDSFVRLTRAVISEPK